MRYEFRWNDWNVEHIGEHGINPTEAESVVRQARPPYPQRIGEEKYLVLGQLADGTHIQVIYVIDDDGVLYVIHARPLDENEKRRYRRRIK